MEDIPVPASDRSAPPDSDVVQMLGDLHVGSVPMTPEVVSMGFSRYWIGWC